jgi:hypothetical protein
MLSDVNRLSSIDKKHGDVSPTVMIEEGDGENETLN